jgi:hypothetical protein
MTPLEQSVYKMIKYLVKTSPFRFNEIENNNFLCKDVANYRFKNAAEDARAKFSLNDIWINFNLKCGGWRVEKFDYIAHKRTKFEGDIEWGLLMNQMQEYFKSEIMANLDYSLKLEEEKRTAKVRTLRANCIMNRELNSIEDLKI